MHQSLIKTPIVLGPFWLKKNPVRLLPQGEILGLISLAEITAECDYVFYQILRPENRVEEGEIWFYPNGVLLIKEQKINKIKVS